MAALLLLLGVLVGADVLRMASDHAQKQKQVFGFGSGSNWKKYDWSILTTYVPTESSGGFDQIDPRLVEHAHANG
jgi:hypothetical protein